MVISINIILRFSNKKNLDHNVVFVYLTEVALHKDLYSSRNKFNFKGTSQFSQSGT